MNTTTTRRMLNKVPEATLYFWVINIFCTTVGGAAATAALARARVTFGAGVVATLAALLQLGAI